MNIQNPVIKDVAITVALAIVAIIVLSGTGFIVGGSFPNEHGVSKQEREKEVALLAKREILSHVFVGAGDDATVSYAYVGEKLPDKFSPDEVVALRTASSWTRQVGVAPDGKAIYTARVYASPQFVEKGDGWHQVEHATVSAQSFQEYEHGTIFSQLFSQPAFALSITQYAQNGDGQLDENDTVWATAHASSTGSLFQCQASLVASPDYVSNIAYVRSYHHTSAGKLDFATVGYCISRAFIPFDTGFIPSGSNISAATLNIYVSSTTDGRNDGTDYVTVVQSSQASWTSLIKQDFDQDGAVTSPTEGVDTGQRKDITSISRNAYLTFTLNSTGIGWIKRLGETSSCGTTTSKIILQGTSDTSWQVPGDWTANNNSIEVIGGGGGGGTGTIAGGQSGGAGGGGGAYSKITNVGMPAGQVVTISVGVGGGADTTGGDTYVCNSTSNCSSISGSAVVVGAKGGGAGTAGGSGGAGGASASGVGSTKYSGGNGGTSTGKGAGGGGGAAGINGAGANGSGPSPTDPRGGGGGGGASGGSAGTAGTGSTGGTGGNNFLGTGGGAANGGQGTGGGGGGGGAGQAASGGTGGGSDPENDWGIINSTTFGPSGGSGGGGASGDCSFIGQSLSPTSYGGGGGGTAGCASGSAQPAATAAQGLIVIQYGNMATGITCLGVREGHDTTNTTMTTDKDDGIGFSTSEASGTSQDPYLSITFTAPPSFWQFQDF